MGEFNTDPPYANGTDTDNTLLYKIARDVNSLAQTDAGDATAANQATQITAEQAILAALNARLGKGAANLVTAQATSTGTAATLVAARATRRSVLITNTEDPATDPDKIAYVGPATVTTGNGYPILPGQSVPFTWVGLIQVIDDNTNHAVLAIADEYD